MKTFLIILTAIFVLLFSLHIVAVRSGEKGSLSLVFNAVCRLLGDSGQAVVPSVMRDPTTGIITSEVWHKNCLLDRTDGPAWIEHDPMTGKVTVERWIKDNKLDRAGGPASIERDAKTGMVTFEGWYKDDKLDRADGPALIRRDAKTGKVTAEEWWKDGKLITPPSDAAKKQ